MSGGCHGKKCRKWYRIILYVSLKGMCILKGIHWREHKTNGEAREECQQENTKPTEKQGKSVNRRTQNQQRSKGRVSTGEHKANREAREECQQENTKPTEKQGKSVNRRT